MSTRSTTNAALSFTRQFTKEGVSPYDMFEYDYRTSVIKNPSGEIVFQMENVEVPKQWSQIATDILAQKYFRKAGVPQADGSTGRETTVKQVAHRMAHCWRVWGERYNYFATPNDAQIFYDELAYSILNQACVPNSPQWFNTGLHEVYGITGKPQGHYYVDPFDNELKRSTSAYERPQPHACFILSVEDDLVNEGGIMDLWVREARIFKYGSGVGTNYSSIRGDGEKLSGGGTSSGLMSFLKIGDRAAGAIKSGGTTRRAAKMVCLDLDHPEIESFVNWKVGEEDKVAALIAAGYPSDYEGEAYKTVSGQNSNNSVRIPNSFFKALDTDGDWELKGRSNGKVMKNIKARELWKQINHAAWKCADPGTQYDTTINEWHTCPEGGPIRASNPCVTADTLVTTHKGLERIGNLVGQSRGIKSFDDKIHWVEKIFVTGNKPVYQLKTKSGYSLNLTADHLVYTLNRGDVPANELSKDDRIQLVKGEFGTETMGGENLAQLAGLLVGDGCITNLNENDAAGNIRRVAFLNMSKDEKTILEWANMQLNELRPVLGEHDKKGNVSDTGTTLRINVGSPRILSIFEKIAVLDKGSEHKQFKDLIFVLSKKEQAAVIRGLFTADGYVANYGDKSQYISLDSVSLDLLKQVQIILLNFGIKAKIYENRRAGKLTSILPNGKGDHKEYPVKEIYSLRISRSSRIVFEDEIGFMEESHKSAQLKKLNAEIATYADHLSDDVLSLEFLGNQDVFDLTESETSHFVANGIAIHNCSEYMFLDNTACNLASVNLRRFFEESDNSFDVKGFEHTCRLWTVVLEISVLMAQFPSKEVAQLSYDYRTLGLGYANLGSMLMVSGIPYDSEEARGIAGAITAIMTGVAYTTSAEMAGFLGAFARYEDNKQHMLRVMRNHRAAAYDAQDAYEGIEIKPQGINAKYCPDYLLTAAIKAWDEAVQLGEKNGYRNAQTTVIAPTGTIGLVMDCDTTGVEPDFALVKFKKLSGGGYFKIINQSVPAALRNLKYSEKQLEEIVNYAKGHATLKGAPFINTQSLLQKGFTKEELAKVEAALGSAFEIGFVFNVYTFGEATLQRLGFTSDQYHDFEWSLLEALGYTDEQIEAANIYVCGTMTVEGAPYLKPEHLAIFDCANKCGQKGERYIHAHGHIRMMAAAQPFLSGAISKTINLPNEATVEEIADCYRMSWELGLKANALYRDGSKLSQPLSNKSDKKKKTTTDTVAEETTAQAENTSNIVDMSKLTVDELLDEVSKRMQSSPDTVLKGKLAKIVERKKLPAKRRGFTQKAKINGQALFLRTGEYGDGTVGEIFIDMAKEGATVRSMLNCFAIAISIGLQYGVPLEEFVEKFVFTRFEPAGMVDHPNIKSTTSIMDFIFRSMAFEYLGRTDLVHVLDKPEVENLGNNSWDENTPTIGDRKPELSEVRVMGTAASSPAGNTQSPSAKAQQAGNDGTQNYMKSMQSDAPSCNTCGHITIRSGTCYKCLNCGNSMGCS